MLFYISHSFEIFWLLTESDVWTFIVPDTAFGILGALAGPVLTTSKATSFSDVILRTPSVLAWNWLNMIVFDLANQRLPVSIAEDRLNKPWRVGPTGRLTSEQMRMLLLVALPVILAISFSLGAWQESSLLFGLTWMYHDLQGGETIVGRNVIISIAFGLYNGASLRVACGSENTVNETGLHWIVIISAIVLSTMQIQDLKDVVGDHMRNRQTMPLIFGDTVTRWSIAVPVLAWSVFCPLYLGLGVLGSGLPVTMGAYVAFRTLWKRSIQADRLSWQIWAFWLISLYVLPLVKDHSVLLDVSLMQP